MATNNTRLIGGEGFPIERWDHVQWDVLPSCEDDHNSNSFGIVASNDLHIEKLDVKTTFLHGDLDLDILIAQPEDA